MSTVDVLLRATAKPVTLTGHRRPGRAAPIGHSSCRYESRPRSRKIVVVSALLSAVVHVALLVDFRQRKPQPSPPPEVHLIALTLAMPDIRELEEPEAKSEEAEGPIDPMVSVPMQPDIPRPPQLGDFVQQLDFDSLIERPNSNQEKMWTIPGVRHGGKIGDGMGNIFNLADLERAPEPVLQPAPVYPFALKHEMLTGTVTVDFIVDAHGDVINPTVYASTHYGFNDAAVAGVQKWKFRPGIRGGRKVNTRLRIPIIFHFVADD